MEIRTNLGQLHQSVHIVTHVILLQPLSDPFMLSLVFQPVLPISDWILFCTASTLLLVLSYNIIVRPLKEAVCSINSLN